VYDEKQRRILLFKEKLAALRHEMPGTIRIRELESEIAAHDRVCVSIS
jgi:hypothetical protein